MQIERLMLKRCRQYEIFLRIDGALLSLRDLGELLEEKNQKSPRVDGAPMASPKPLESQTVLAAQSELRDS